MKGESLRATFVPRCFSLLAFKTVVFATMHLRCSSGQAVERDPARTDDAYSFNVSHHGNWVILGAAHTKAIGIDITRHEQPRGCKTVEECVLLVLPALSAIQGSLPWS